MADSSGVGQFTGREAAGAGGRNITGFRSADTQPGDEERNLGSELEGLVAFRDFATQIVPRARRIHDAFNDCVPFVPLWHLDRHTLVHTGLKVYVDDAVAPSHFQVLNPTVLFQNVGRWRLE